MTFGEFLQFADKKARSKDPSFTSILCVLFMFSYIYCLKAITFLTRCRPFSNLFTGSLIHYQNQDVGIALARVESLVSGFGVAFYTRYINKDDYFIKLVGDVVKVKVRSKDPIPYKDVEARLLEEGIYFRQGPAGLFEVLVSRK